MAVTFLLTSVPVMPMAMPMSGFLEKNRDTVAGHGHDMIFLCSAVTTRSLWAGGRRRA